MSKQYSIAEARQNLAALVHDLEHLRCVQLTRRNKPVAILLSIETFNKLSRKEGGFWQAYSDFRSKWDLVGLSIEPEIFAGVRDNSPGRRVKL